MRYCWENVAGSGSARPLAAADARTVDRRLSVVAGESEKLKFRQEIRERERAGPEKLRCRCTDDSVSYDTSVCHRRRKNDPPKRRALPSPHLDRRQVTATPNRAVDRPADWRHGAVAHRGKSSTITAFTARSIRVFLTTEFFYGLEDCPLLKYQYKSNNYVINSTFRKIFDTR